MEILELSTTPPDKVIKRACQILAEGGLVLFPTETTYGAGVDATNPQAVQKLLDYKSRREGKPLSIAVTDETMAETYVELNDSARRLYARYLPGPVTVVSKSKDTVAPGVASEFGTVGVRIPDYPLLLEILKTYGKPITATSANGSGQKRPYSTSDVFEHISAKQKSLIDLVLDAGTLPPNPPSTVIDTTHATPVSLRTGELESDIVGQASTQTIKTHAAEETKNLAGKVLLKHWDVIKSRGLIVGLNGELGTGKTIFAKGIAEFLKISEPITSPTYTYVQEYEYDRHGQTGKLYHLDVWRVESAEELERLGWTEMMKPGNVVVVEWWTNISSFATIASALIVITLLDIGNQDRQLLIKDLDA